MIVIEITENPNYRRYYTRFKITDGYHHAQTHGHLPFHDLLETEVPGLLELPSIDGYRMLVQKVPTFTWDEIDAKLLPILHQMNHSIGVTSEVVEYKGLAFQRYHEKQVPKG